MRNFHGTPVWYELMTRDPAAAKRFYDAVVGWEIEVRPSDPSGEVEYRMIGAPGGPAGGVLTLTDTMVAGGARPGWFGYVGVNDVDETVERVEAAGGSTLMPPRDTPGVGRMAMVADPQGMPFYIMRGQSDEPTTVFSMDTVGLCSWNELSTTDPADALRFYIDVFGWEKGNSMPMGELGDYQFLDHQGEMIGAVMKTPPGAGASQWTYYFRVSDIDAAHEAATTGGGTVLQGPLEIPGGDYMLLVSDPEGAVFGAVGARSP